MPDVHFKRYTPGTTPYAKRRTEDEWNEHRHLLTRLHNQYYTRRQMLTQLRDRGFEVTSGQLLAQMKKWDLMVYSTAHRFEASGSDAAPSAADSTSPQAMSTGLPGNDDVEVSDLRDAGFMGGLRLTNSTGDELSGDVDNANDAFCTETEASGTDLQPPPPYEAVPDTLASTNVESRDFQGERPLPPPTMVAYAGWNLAEPRVILQQLDTIREPWCDRFPMSCCCRDLFFGTAKFATSPEIYKVLLNQSSPTSLQHAWALLNLTEIGAVKETDPRLQSTFRSAVERYLRICTRPGTKNRQATLLLHRFLSAWSQFDDRLTSLPKSSVRQNGDAFRRMFRLRPLKLPKTPHATSNFDWEAVSERDVSTIVGFTVRGPSLFPLTNWSGLLFGSMDNWSSVRKEDDAIALVNTATGLAEYMQQTWLQSPSDIVGDLGDCDLPTVFNALGLMIALELDEYARSLVHQNGILSDSSNWPEELKSFIQTTVKTLSLNSEYADKFRKCYWLGRTPSIGLHGKAVHFGECKASHEWGMLALDIHAFDEERTWIERRLFSNASSWPQPEDLADADSMSIRSTSSINSFRRFQALALHLKLGTGTPNSRSIRTKSTKSKMSVDSHLSWQLENILQIKEETGQCDDNHDAKQRSDLDEQAFQQIQEDANSDFKLTSSTLRND